MEGALILVILCLGVGLIYAFGKRDDDDSDGVL
jgi:hypothetical protein